VWLPLVPIRAAQLGRAETGADGLARQRCCACDRPQAHLEQGGRQAPILASDERQQPSLAPAPHTETPVGEVDPSAAQQNALRVSFSEPLVGSRSQNTNRTMIPPAIADRRLTQKIWRVADLASLRFLVGLLSDAFACRR
jgi:hypothetical protein